MSQNSDVDVRIDALSERIEIAKIANLVIRERIEELDKKLAGLERDLLE